MAMISTTRHDLYLTPLRYVLFIDSLVASKEIGQLSLTINIVITNCQLVINYDWWPTTTRYWLSFVLGSV